MKIKAFTLAEAIVMIGVLGIITAVAIPTLVKKDFKTNTNIRAASKVYSALAQIVSNAIQDGYYYRRFDVSGLADNSEGVDVLTGKLYSENNGSTAPEKFRDILLDGLFVANVVNWSSDTNHYTQFDTTDGVRWKLKWNSQTFQSLNNPMVVYIDTNIKNGSDDFVCNNSNNCRVVDSLALLVHRNGNVMIDGTDSNSTYYVEDDDGHAYNDEEFVKEILGQHEDTKVVSNEEYYNN